MASLAQPAQSNTSLLTSVAATFNQAPQAGNLLVAFVTASVGTGSIAISNAGWSAGPTIAVGIAGGMCAFYKVAAAGGGDTTVTATATLAAFMDLHIFEWDGIDNAVPLDKSATSADAGSGVTSHNTGSTGTLTQANELAVCAVAQVTANGGGASWNSSFNTDLTTTHLISGDLSVTATTALNPTASWTNSVRAAGLIMTFYGETGDTFYPRWGLKPAIPRVNWNNPVTKGLVFDYDPTERGGTVTYDPATRIKGTFNGTPTWKTDPFGPTISFNGTTDYIDYPVLPNQKSLTTVSIEFLCTWVNNANNGSLIDKGNSGTQSRYFGVRPDQGSSSFVFFLGYSGNVPGWGSVAGSLVTTAWMHGVVTHPNIASTSATPNWYINGVLNNNYAINVGPSGSLSADDNTLDIGHRTSSAVYYQGRIAYCRYWNRVLNQQEVVSLYENPWSIYYQTGLIYNKSL